MTWKEVKLATLQKMFSAEGLVINEADDSVSEYLNAMPQAANEGLQLLCTAGKYLRRCHEFEAGAEGETRTVDLAVAVPDLYRIEQLELYSFDEEGVPVPVRGAKLVAGRYLVLPRQPGGKLALYYNAWPQPVTAATPDEEELPLDPEVAVLLPLYMSSQLYKDDDVTLATMYRNEFEVAFSLLQRADSGEVGGEFTSATGWW
ncbi:MAG TPA: hypothetical protein H9813_01800 [Candidatus Fournierella merdipullorum]|uniref:Uncharacterized protein n=1 Tax=Candidatus Allofournierella merdipullorum TaxID=2838595 RepID=A0A9D2E363_9FIRM|nr:hypothetical protein [Candidatus Fournierella merdipullorum]